MKNYSVLAKYYDRFSQNDCDYESWSQYLCSVCERFGVKEIVELACGTGKMTKLLVERGYSLLGIDQSPEMLVEASAKCRAKFVCMDMKKLTLTRPAEMVVVVNDGLNYLKQSELLPFFQRVALSLKKGAPFVFDVSTAYKLQRVLANNVFFVDEDDATLLWTNTSDKCKTVLSLTLFEKQGDVYTRCDETHTQFVHTREEIEQALCTAGFVLDEVSDSYGSKPTAESLRLTFCAHLSKQE